MCESKDSRRVDNGFASSGSSALLTKDRCCLAEYKSVSGLVCTCCCLCAEVTGLSPGEYGPSGYRHLSPSSDIRSFVAFVSASVPRAGGMCSWEISSCMFQSTGNAAASRKDWNARDSEGVSNDIVREMYRESVVCRVPRRGECAVCRWRLR